MIVLVMQTSALLFTRSQFCHQMSIEVPPTAIIAPGPKKVDQVFHIGTFSPLTIETLPNTSESELSAFRSINAVSSRSSSEYMLKIEFAFGMGSSEGGRLAAHQPTMASAEHSLAGARDKGYLHLILVFWGRGSLPSADDVHCLD